MEEDQLNQNKQRGQNTSLLKAVYTENLLWVRRLLESTRANKDTRCRVNLMSACHIAAYNGSVEIMQELLKKGADPRVVDKKGRQPHHLAAFSNREGSLECLLEILDAYPGLLNSPVLEPGETLLQPEVLDWLDHDHDTLTNLVTENIPLGSSALTIATIKRNVNKVKMLLKKNATVDQETVEAARNFELKWRLIVELEVQSLELAPIQKAVLQGEVKEVNDLLDQCEDVEELPPNLLHLAVHNKLKTQKNKDNYTNILEMLLKRAVQNVDTAELINNKDQNEMTPLYLAVEYNWMDDVAMLLEYGADISVQCRGGETVVHAIARINNSDLLEDLRPDKSILMIMDDKKCTPLYSAINTGSANSVQALLKLGAMEMDENYKVIHAAIEAKNCEVLKKILEFRDWRGKNIPNIKELIALAAEKGVANCLEVLFSTFEVSLNYKAGTNEDTPLHQAAKKGHLKCIEILLDKCGSLINIKDSQGRTALIHVIRGNYRMSVQKLLERGADLAAKDPELNRTALDMIMSNIPDVVDMIKEVLDSFVVPLGPNDIVRKDDDRLTQVIAQSPSSSPASGSPAKKKEVIPLLSKNTNQNKAAQQSYPEKGCRLDYRCLLAGERQLEVIEAFKDCKHNILRELFFLHPLVRTFLLGKWKQLDKIFFYLLAIYFVHVVSVTGLALSHYIYHNSITAYLCTSLVLVTIIPIIYMEIISFLLEAQIHSTFESCIKWSAIGSTACLCLVGSISDVWWGRYLASVAILLSWILLLLFYSVGRKGSFHVLLFFKVARNAFQVFSSFLFIFAGFAVALFVLFDGKAPFPDLVTSLVQVFAMVTELKFDSAFEKDSGETLPFKILGRIFYLGFYLLIIVVLMNLIVGLSVNVVTKHRGKSKHLALQSSFLSFVDKFYLSGDKFRLTSWLWNLAKDDLKKIFGDESESERYFRSNCTAEETRSENRLLYEVMAIVNGKHKNKMDRKLNKRLDQIHETVVTNMRK